MQIKQQEWLWQWSRYKQSGDFLFDDWIYPNTIKDFKNKTVVDCGCGSGDHLIRLAPYIKKGLGVDLNAASVASERFKKYLNLSAIEGDLATIKLDEQFDIVYCIGVLQHTENPAKTFANIGSFVKPEGRLILWVYSWEGNFLNRTLLEFAKRHFFLKLPKPFLEFFSHMLTLALFPIIYTVYFLPLRFLPFYEYFQNWRRLGYHRNYLNVLDKLNAPTTNFIKKTDLDKWFNSNEFNDVHISSYEGVSWRASGTKK